MTISASYICPIRGLDSLHAPEPDRLSQAAKTAMPLGIESLILHVLEEPLYGPTRTKVDYLDGVVRALDCIGDSGSSGWIIAPARRILGIDWVPPCLVRATKDPKAIPVYLEGRIWNLWPYNWWKDINIFQKRIEIFRELCSAVSGHPSLKGWTIMDRELDWYRPDMESADLFLKSILSEIKERDEDTPIHIGLSWLELLEPELAKMLAKQVDGIQISGLDKTYKGLDNNQTLDQEIYKAAYIGSIANWLFKHTCEIEMGWSMVNSIKDPEAVFEAFEKTSNCGLRHINWLTLVDPEPRLFSNPPWIAYPGLEKAGILDRGLEPKEFIETLFGNLPMDRTDQVNYDFIDLSPEEYSLDPHTHMIRLWDHFREAYH